MIYCSSPVGKLQPTYPQIPDVAKAAFHQLAHQQPANSDSSPSVGNVSQGLFRGGRARTTKCRIDGRVRDGAERFTRIRSRDGCRQLKGIVPAGDARRESGIQSAFAFVSANASHVVGGRRQQGERAQEERRRRRRRRGMEGIRFSIFSSYPRVAPFSVKRPRSEKATGKSGARAAS